MAQKFIIQREVFRTTAVTSFEVLLEIQNPSPCPRLTDQSLCFNKILDDLYAQQSLKSTSTTGEKKALTA